MTQKSMLCDCNLFTDTKREFSETQIKPHGQRRISTIRGRAVSGLWAVPLEPEATSDIGRGA